MRSPRTGALLALLWAGACGADPPVTPHDAGAGGAVATGGADAGRPPPLACGSAATEIDPASTPELAIQGDPGADSGVFDASLLYPKGASRGLMAYSRVAAKDDIHTRIAASTDGGLTWAYLGDANHAEPASITAADCPGGECQGKLIHEVSSLVEDAKDPDPARRFKLFSHRYLALPGGALRYDLGHIALQTAPAPEGPWGAPKAVIGWPSASPFSSNGTVFLTTDAPAVASCVILTEPGAFVSEAGEIDLALGCPRVGAGGVVSIAVELLRSADHALSFHHVATLLRPEDSACLGVAEGRLNAAEMFLWGGVRHLVVTPESAETGYHGCVVIPFADPAEGSLARNDAGEPAFVQRLDVTTHQFTGACSFAEGAAALGFVVPIAFLGDPRPFRLFVPGLGPP